MGKRDAANDQTTEEQLYRPFLSETFPSAAVNWAETRGKAGGA